MFHKKPTPHIAGQDNIFRGILMGITAFFMLAVMNVFVKLLTPTHHFIELAFYRNLIPLVLFLIYVMVTRNIDLLKTNRPIPVFLRAVIGTCGLFLTFMAVQMLPLSDATVLFFASTLIVPILSVIFLKEHIGIHRISAIIIGFCGVLIIAAPSGDFKGLGIFVALGAALGHSIIQIFLRYLRTENPLTVLFYFMLGGTIIPAFAMPYYASTIPQKELWMFLCLGLSGGLAQYFLTQSFKLAPASVISPFNYTALIWATGFDIFIWHHIPEKTIYIGAAFIIGSNLYILHRERVRKKMAEKELKLSHTRNDTSL